VIVVGGGGGGRVVLLLLFHFIINIKLYTFIFSIVVLDKIIN